MGEVDDSQSMAWNKINLSIDSIKNDQVKSHSVVAGNSRPFEGKVVAKKGHELEITAKEPGDDPDDGVFHFRLDQALGTSYDHRVYDTIDYRRDIAALITKDANQFKASKVRLINAIWR